MHRRGRSKAQNGCLFSHTYLSHGLLQDRLSPLFSDFVAKLVSYGQVQGLVHRCPQAARATGLVGVTNRSIGAAQPHKVR